MSGIDGLMAQPNDRWAQAARRAQGIADNGLGEGLKAYYTRYFPIGLVVILAAGTLGGILAFRATLADWGAYLVFGFFLAVPGVLVGGLVYNAKKLAPAVQAGRVDVMLSLESEERKQVRRQIAGKTAIDSEHLAVTRAAAVQLRKGLARFLLVAPMFPLLFIPQAMSFAFRGDSPAAWLMAIGVVAVLIGLVLSVRDFRRAGRFLARTADQIAPR